MQLNRLFFALWPGEAVRKACSDATRELKVKLQPSGYLSAPERYHMTMLFLGDRVSAAHEASAVQAARLVRMAPFTLTLDHAGSFRNTRNVPWWLGPRRTPPQLSLLHDRLRDAMLRTDTPIERMRFSPHLTVLRADRPLPPTPIAPVEWPIDEFVLIRSRLDLQPIAYEIVGRWPLAGDDDSAPPPARMQLDLGF
ncbi:MAG TPA: RNA 2',3'-cyclic phosphodiesterase [Solimonas sp.]|nr:RNA 2',3'-cyclic phosphodiesterase [Solimonas sp.]